MLLLTASLFAISAAGSAWVFARWRHSRNLVADRLSNMPGHMTFPYNIYDASAIGSKKSYDIPVDKMMGQKRMAEDLFLAGVRNQKNIRFFFFLIQLSIILPLCMVAGYALAGSLHFNNLLGAVIVGVVVFVTTRIFVQILKKKRQQRILKNLPQFLDLIIVCVETGLSFTSALERILKEEDPKEPLTQEFNLMYHEFLGGLSLPQACERLDKRCGVPDLSVILSAVIQSDQMGASLGNSLRVQAAELRDKLRQRVRTKAFQVPVKILFPMMLIFFAFILLNLGYIGFQLNTVITNNELFKVKAKPSSGAARTSRPVYRTSAGKRY